MDFVGSYQTHLPLPRKPSSKQKQLYAKMFLDYVNNFLTTTCFADYYGLTEKEALEVLKRGRAYHEQRAMRYKRLYKLRG